MTALARRGHRARQGAAAIAHGRRSWRAALLTGMVAAGASAALATAPIASGATGAAGAHAVGPHLGRAVTVHLPLNAGPGTPIIESASCASATSCTLAGTYSDNTSVDQAMVVSRSGGHWSRAIELQLPANADAGIGGLAESVSCSRAGSCVAVGSYRSNGVFEGFTAAESGGVWHQAKQVRLPANAATTGGASISGVSCTGPGACVLAGNYTDNHGHVRPMVATESKGTWARARELRVPTGASTTGRVLLTSVACPKLGSCAAVGQFDDKSGHARAMAVTESGGTWHQALQLILPKDAAGVPLVSTVSVGCSSAGNCVAVGSYRTKSSKFVPMSVAESRGAWARGQHVTKVPANAAASGQCRAHIHRLYARGHVHRGRQLRAQGRRLRGVDHDQVRDSVDGSDADPPASRRRSRREPDRPGQGDRLRGSRFLRDRRHLPDRVIHHGRDGRHRLTRPPIPWPSAGRAG